MAPIIAPGVARFALGGTVHGRPWVNIYDMHIESGGIGGRDENVEDQAQVFLNNWIDELANATNPAVILTGCSWVDLDSLDGSTGRKTAASGGRIMPHPGTQGGATCSANVAVLVRKQAGSGRGSRPGRSYLVGVGETQTTGNLLTPAYVDQLQEALSLFLSGVSQSGATSIGGYDSHMVVVHVAAGGGVSHTDVTSLDVDALLATQRRRLRG